MQWNRTVNYALLALGHLAEHGENRSILAKEISEHYSIPTDYLLKVLHLLARGGILTSVRGPSGGYRLSRGADQINILEIVEVVSGPSSLESVTESGTNGKISERIRSVFTASESAASEVLRRTTLASLASKG